MSKRKREPEETVAAKDLSALSDVLTACFGKDGNFTVIVEEPSGEAHQDTEGQQAAKRTEFKVWSFLLAQWSPVFGKMVGSDNYAESQRAEVVIQDFSASAVETFLRFMYSGSVEGSVTAVMEVAAMADKYQVDALQSLCLPRVRKALKPELACEIFAAADRFQMDDLRAEARDLIFTEPAEALKKRPAIRPELLAEILGSGLLCIPADDLKKLFRSWGEKGCDALESIINTRARSEYTDDVLDTLWSNYEAAGNKGVFLSYWVSMILGPGQGDAYTMDDLEVIASNQAWALTLGEGWVQWLLPHSWVHLQGFDFGTGTVSATTSFRIWSSEDGATWHLAYESQRKELAPGSFLACKRPPSLVKYFKLEVLEGKLVNVCFNIQGILQQLQVEKEKNTVKEVELQKVETMYLRTMAARRSIQDSFNEQRDRIVKVEASMAQREVQRQELLRVIEGKDGHIRELEEDLRRARKRIEEMEVQRDSALQATKMHAIDLACTSQQSNLRFQNLMAHPLCQSARRRWAIQLAFVPLLVQFACVTFGIQKQPPLSGLREKTGLALHTRAPLGETILSNEGKLLLSEISEAGRRGDWLKVQKLYGAYGGGETQIFTAVMHIAMNCSQFSQGAAVYQKPCSLNVCKTSATFTAALKLHAKLNQTEAVKRIWSEALSTCPLNEVLAGARIDAAAVAGDVKTAAEVLDLINHTSGIRTDVAHITSAIRACWEAEGQSHHAATYLFQYLLDLGLEPNIATYTCLIGAYATAPLPRVLTAYERLKSSNVTIDSPFTEVYLVTVLQKPKPEDWRGQKLIEKLKARSPDRLAAAKVALDDFDAAGVELTGLSLAIQKALRKLDEQAHPQQHLQSAREYRRETGRILDMSKFKVAPTIPK
ncbi:PPR4 [Symbiodinium microadriaticum]|nr:PPR4 [Symbiodinium microadriaticum]